MGGFGRIPSGFSDQDDYLPLHLPKKKSHCSFGIALKQAMTRYEIAQCVRFERHHLCTFRTSDWLKSGCQQKSLLASAAIADIKCGRGF